MRLFLSWLPGVHECFRAKLHPVGLGSDLARKINSKDRKTNEVVINYFCLRAFRPLVCTFLVSPCAVDLHHRVEKQKERRMVSKKSGSPNRYLRMSVPRGCVYTQYVQAVPLRSIGSSVLFWPAVSPANGRHSRCQSHSGSRPPLPGPDLSTPSNLT